MARIDKTKNYSCCDSNSANVFFHNSVYIVVFEQSNKNAEILAYFLFHQYSAVQFSS